MNNNNHTLYRLGEYLACKHFQVKPTSHKATFDGIDRRKRIAYEFKSVNANGPDIKVHISDKAYIRKLQYSLNHRLSPVVIVLLFNGKSVKLYKAKLKQSIRLNSMEFITELNTEEVK